MAVVLCGKFVDFQSVQHCFQVEFKGLLLEHFIELIKVSCLNFGVVRLNELSDGGEVV